MTVNPAGTLDSRAVGKLRDILDLICTGDYAEVVVDLSRVIICDGSVLILAPCVAEARQRGVALTFAAHPPFVRAKRPTVSSGVTRGRPTVPLPFSYDFTAEQERPLAEHIEFR